MSLIQACGYFIITLPSIQVGNARWHDDVCQDGERTIGNDNCTQYEVEERSAGRLYLNVDNPAQCNGIISHWEYCYYLPENRGVYRVYFAVYRQRVRGNVQYQRQSPIMNLSVNNYESEDSFICDSFTPMEHISVQQGDFIGICLPRTNSLDIVSITSDGSHDNDRLRYRNRGADCSNTEFPETINEFHTQFQESRIAHLYAEITSKTNIILSSSLYDIFPCS